MFAEDTAAFRQERGLLVCSNGVRFKASTTYPYWC